MERLIRRRDGFALVDVLVALTVLGIAAVAISGLALNAAASARRAAFEGRRAALAQSVADRVRAGLLPGDSGTVRARVAGDTYEVVFVRHDTLGPGSLELTARRASPSVALALGAARPVP